MTHPGSAGSAIIGGGREIPDSVVDYFEEALYEDEGKTLSDYYTRDVADFSRQQSVVLQGDYTLTTSASTARIFSTSGLPRYPSQGDTPSVDLRYGTGDTREIHLTHFAVQSDQTDKPDSYRLKIDTNDSDFGAAIVLEKISSGSETTLDSDSSVDVSALADETLTWQFDNWASDGTISISLLDSSGTQQGTLSATDDTFGSGGIGFQSFSESSTVPNFYWDDYRI
jgi:hypothetical protein